MTSANPNQFGSHMQEENMYMEQEEEWEREGLLDPAWEKQQRKVIVNSLFYLPLILANSTKVLRKYYHLFQIINTLILFQKMKNK